VVGGRGNDFFRGLGGCVVTLTLSGRKVLRGGLGGRKDLVVVGGSDPRLYIRVCFGWERGGRVVEGV